MDKRANMLRGLDLRGTTGIEIGPLMSPLVSRTDGDILYIDHVDTESLRAKYTGHAGIDPARIVEVDAVWGTNTLQQAIGDGRTVDYVLASHVVEHVPDLLGWLTEIHNVLHPGGTLRLAIPDRRFTFDLLRQESRLSDILNARLLLARKPLPAQILDHVLEVAAVDVQAAWQGEVRPAGLERLHSLEDALRMAEDALRTGSYHDVHCWVFTPSSFAQLLGRAASLGLHGFACIDFHDTEPGELEFQVTLQSSVDLPAAAASWDRMAQEVRESAAGSDLLKLLALQRESEVLRQRVSECEAEAATLRTQLVLTQQQVVALENSTSWRITEPLRSVVRTTLKR